MALRASSDGLGEQDDRTTLSDDFLRRIFSLVAMEEGWNGGREARIAPSSAAIAVRVASASLEFAPEPSVGPSPDGAVLLEWHLSPGVDFETYVRTEGAASFEVVISRSGALTEAAPSDTNELLALLQACVAA